MTPRTPLQRARDLDQPAREATLRRAPSVHAFWADNRVLLPEAWSEWEASAADLPVLDETLLDPRLRAAVQAAWENPDSETSVRALWQPVIPGVFQCPFFDPRRLEDLRAYLDAAAQAQIPVRPPYGIVLNRHGVMLDRRSDGYLAAPGFQALYQRLMDGYMRPISRLLFPEVTGYDTQNFGFSIRYQPGKDTSIRPHSDASATTLNICLNTPEDTFTGSEVDFFGPGGQRATFTFTPGMAVIHRGNVAHAARPIASGERSNLVLWLYGDRGQVPFGPDRVKAPSAQQRWTVPSVAPDGFAPF